MNSIILYPVLLAFFGFLFVVNRRIEKTFTSTNLKLDAVHVLVNSNMSASMQAELDGAVRELAMMHEVIELKKAAGQEPSKMALDAIIRTEGRIDELQARINDRLHPAAGG